MIAAIACPTVVTALAALPGKISTTVAALVYVLAVVAAAVGGGLRAGVLASLLSFLALNFFFTEPLGTLSVEKTQDLVALAVYLVTSSLVGALVSSALTQRSRAERREQEALLLHHLGTGFLSGQRVDDVLERFAGAVTELLELARCEIETESTRPVVVALKQVAPAPSAEAVVVPMVTNDREVGRISVLPRAGARVGRDQLDVIVTFASQVALALGAMRLASEAQEARIEAETNKLRATLLSSVTHDLRTPLASITASVTSLLDERVSFSPGDHRELLETTRQEAERLNRLVGNLLELSRLRAGALVVAKSRAAIDEVIEGVLARLGPLLSDHDVRVMLRDDLPEAMLDVVQIDQLLTNLLENAAKFSPSGSQITVSAGRWHNGVRVRVVDGGPGVPPGERERVFEPFVRGRSADGTGTGLGLSIARAIVAAHGGRIWLEEAPGGGTAVTFELPVTL